MDERVNNLVVSVLSYFANVGNNPPHENLLKESHMPRRARGRSQALLLEVFLLMCTHIRGDFNDVHPH